MGQAVAYDDLPDGFRVGGQASTYDDLPAGFAVGGTQPSLLDTFTAGAYAPFRPIVNNTLESLKNTATQTGEAVSEPMLTNPNEPTWLKPIDATVRLVGKAGNALGGAYGALLSPAVGALSASVEPTVPAQIKAGNSLAGGNAAAITPEQVHQLAMQEGGDLANAVMLGKAGEQGAAAVRKQQGLPPEPPPKDPLQPLYDKLSDMSAATGPRSSFLGSNSSDPMYLSQKDTPSASTDQLYEAADKLFGQADAAKAVIGSQKMQGILSNAKSELDNSNFDPDFHPQTAKLLAKLEAASQDEDGNPAPMPWSKVNGYRKLLNGIINDSMKQGGTEDGYQAIRLRSALDDGTGSILPADLAGGDAAAIPLTRQANALWSAASKQDAIQAILDKGQNAAVPATAYAKGFDRLANSPAFKTYTPEEQAAIREAARTGIVTGALKTMGGKLVSGFAGAVGGAAGGGFHGAMLGAAAGEGVGFPLRAAASAIQRGKGTAVQTLIGQRPAVQDALQTAMPPTAPPPAAPVPPSAPTPPIPALPLAPTQSARTPPTPAVITPPAPVQPATPTAPQAQAAPLIDRIAQAESGGNPTARNPNSTASGPLQFTDDTWARSVAKWGKQTGITLKDKNDPQAQATMGQLLARDNARIMTKQIGRPPTDGEIYAAHFFGAHDVVKLITAAQNTPDKQAVMLYPRKLVGDNRPIFFDGNRPRSVAEVYQLLNGKVS